MNGNIFFSRSLPAIIFLLVIGILSYANSFGVPFVFDDQTSITENPVIRSLENFYANAEGYEYNPRRFIGYLTFALNYRLGGFDVFGYHLFNLGIHLANALLLYILVRITFRSPFLRDSKFAPHAGAVALISSLFFVVHPVQTQAVTYIVQRLTSLTALFFLLSLVLYAQARLSLDEKSGVSRRETGERPPKAGAGGRGKPAWLIAGSVLAAVMAMKTKEIAFTLPFVVLLFEASFFRGEWKKRLLYLLPVLLTAAIVPLSVLASGSSAGDLLSDVSEQSRVQTDIPRLHYLFTQFRVIVTYLRLLIFPVNQNLDYDYPLSTTFWTPPVFLSFLFLASLLGLAVSLYLRSGRSPQSSALSLQPSPELRLISFGIFWFFLTLLVESSLIPIEDVIFEHRLYLPSIGAVIAAGSALVMAAESRFRNAVWPAVAIIVLCLGAGTYTRNTVWKSSVSLWQDVVRKSPAKIRPYNNLGAALNDADQPEAAIPVLLQAVRIKPDHADAWYNLGRAYILTNRNGEAVHSLMEAQRLNPEDDKTIINLAAALNRERRFQDAAKLLESNFARLAGLAEARFNLGVSYVYLGNIEGAWRELEAVSRLDPRLAAPLADLLRRRPLQD